MLSSVTSSRPAMPAPPVLARVTPTADDDGACAPGWLPHFRGLRAMVAVAEQGTVVRAAEVLHLSQPAVTRALRSLEDLLGFALFERCARGMLPTPAGRILTERARRAFSELEQASAAITMLAGAGRKAQGQRFAAMVGPHLLDSLVAVAEQGSGPQAGHKLGRSQPTVHRNLAELEHLAGVVLFNRTAFGTRLTEAGETLLCGVKRALASLAVAHEELAPFGGRPTAQVRIGALPLSIGVLVPQAVDRLLSACPHLQVTIVDGTYDALVQQLRRAEIDLIVGALRPLGAPRDMVQEPLFQDRLMLVARAGHPCLAQPPRCLAELVDHAWIVPLPQTPARLVFERLFQSADLPLPAARLQVNSPAMVRTLLLGSDRLALLSPLQIEAELRSGQLAVVPLPGLDASRTIGASTRLGGSLSPAVLALLDELRAVAGQLVPVLQRCAKNPAHEPEVKAS